MRKIVYDCYYRNARMKTVDTFSAAEEWRKQDSKNTVRERLINWTKQKEETEKEKEERINRRERKVEAIRRRAKMR